MILEKSSNCNIYQGRLEKGDDLIEEITKLVIDKNIKSGLLNGIGALSSANIGYYDQSKHEYVSKEFIGEFEIVSLTGNISYLEGVPFVHAHIALSRDDFSLIGGHLFPGNIVYAFEFAIKDLELNNTLVRDYDPLTGLKLWKNDS